jgi:PAS domain S-box-containing protein
LETGISIIDTKWVKKDGTVINVLLSSSPLDENDLSRGVSFTALDVTEERRAIDALAEEKERLSVTLRSIGDGVIATDTEGRIVLINHVAEDLTGWTQEECIGKPLNSVFNIIHEVTRKPCHNPVEKVLQSKQIEELANHNNPDFPNGQERVIPIVEPLSEIRTER